MYYFLYFILLMSTSFACSHFNNDHSHYPYLDDCGFRIDITRHPEYTPFAGKYTLIWFAEASSATMIQEMQFAADFLADLSAAQRQRLAFVFVNRESYAEQFANMLAHASEGVHVVQEQGETWSWDYFGGEFAGSTPDTSIFFDQRGYQADWFAFGAAKNSGLVGDSAPTKLTFFEMEDHGSPCEHMQDDIAYLGCWRDSPYARIFAFQYSRSNPSVAQCVSGCRSLGYRYMGMQNQNQCYCGRADEDFTALGQRTTCYGGEGAGYAMDVYDLDPFQPTSEPSPIPTLFPTTPLPTQPAWCSDLDSPAAFVIDVRTEDEWVHDGRLACAALLPVQALSAGQVDALTGTDTAADIYVYCRSGNRAETAVNLLKSWGYSNAKNIGGLDDILAMGCACNQYSAAIHAVGFECPKGVLSFSQVNSADECMARVREQSAIACSHNWFNYNPRDAMCYCAHPSDNCAANPIASAVTHTYVVETQRTNPLAQLARCHTVEFTCSVGGFAGTYEYSGDVDNQYRVYTKSEGDSVSTASVSTRYPQVIQTVVDGETITTFIDPQQTFSVLVSVPGSPGSYELYQKDAAAPLATLDCAGRLQCEQTAVPTLAPTPVPTTPAPSRQPTADPSASPLPWPEHDIVELKRRVEDLSSRVVACEEASDKMESLQEIDTIMAQCSTGDFLNFTASEGGSPAEPYAADSQGWYQALKASEPVALLSNADFAAGTLRITTPGRYVLTEDIEFNPRPEDDSFPDVMAGTYPMNLYFLGFWAAIAVETTDVWIDLNGFEIRQSERHNAMQRFYNNIELADRLFVAFEGMASMNYQANDRQQYNEENGPRHGTINSAARVIISNGTLGLSSHNGVHGNGNSHVVIENVHVRNFEVAGIQLNGADNFVIRNVEVGPSNAAVKFRAQWSAAIVMRHYLKRFIPYSMQKFGTTGLLQNTVTFADRPNTEMTYQDVFDALNAAVDQYTAFVLEGGVLEPDSRLHRMFNNSARLPDGSAMYGIFLHRLGAGPETFAAQDENYFGPEHFNGKLEDIRIHDLRSAPVISPSLVFNDGTILQGPARDVVEFLDALSNSLLMGIQEAEYSGNPLTDAYVAMALLSRDFYRAYVFDSECGNFASNLTAAYLSEEVPRCGNPGTFVTPGLTGRDITLLQKRIFGGLRLSQGFLDFATVPGTTLESLLRTAPDFTARRQTKHHVACNHDALFHPNKGIVGVRMEFMGNVSVDGVTVEDIYNSGDLDHFLCTRQYRLFSTQEDFMTESWTPGAHKGPDVRGMAIGKCESIDLHHITMNRLESEEGAVLAFDITTDTSDRSDYETGAVSFDQSSIAIGELRGGAGSMVKAIEQQQIAGRVGAAAGLETTADFLPDFHNEFDNAKLNIVFENRFYRSCDSAENAHGCLADMGVTAGFMKQLNRDFEKFMRVRYGMDVGLNHSAPWWDLPEHPDYVYLNNLQRGNVDFVCRKNKCDLPRDAGTVYERYLILSPTREFTVYGTYGGTHGKVVYPDEFLLGGAYVVQGVTDHPLVMTYFGECPLSHTRMKYRSENFDAYHRISYMANCALESEELGIGVSIGLLGGLCTTDGIDNDFYNAAKAMMTFDDQPRMFVESDFGAPQTTPQRVVMWESMSNGLLGVTKVHSGILTHGYTSAYHMLNEAGLRAFRKWCGYSDSDILKFRSDALDFLRNHIELAFDPALFATDPLDNQLDLGGGNNIVPYAVTEMANHHLVGMKSMDGATVSNARVHEMGFLLRVGRAGIDTYAGHVPYGSVVHYGIYAVEFPSGVVPVRFYDHYPEVTNTNSHVTFIQRLVHPTYGGGLGQGIALILPKGDKMQLSFRFNWRWDV